LEYEKEVADLTEKLNTEKSGFQELNEGLETNLEVCFVFTIITT